MPLRILYAVTLALVLLPEPAAGQEAPRFGLALSGGGARGLAHVGALQVLHDAGLAPDLVSGASMGAVVGGLYASGIEPDSLASIVREADWGVLLTGSGAPGGLVRSPEREPELAIEVPLSGFTFVIPSALSAGQQAASYLALLTWPVRNIDDFSQLPTPFVAVATDLGTGEGVPLRHGNLAQAMRASLAIPAVFAPVEIDGRPLVDGGLARNLPAQDAREMGADVLACVNVATPLRPASALEGLDEVFAQTVALLTAQADSLQRSLCDVVVTPDLGELTLSDFDEADSLIALGAEAMREALPRIRALVGQRRSAGRSLAGSPRAARIAAVRVINDDGRLPERWVRASAGVLAGSGVVMEVDADDVDLAVSRAYATRSFETVFYEVRTGDGSSDTLVLRVAERPRGRIGAGLRFDSANRAAALIRAHYAHLGWAGSSLAVGVRLGRELAATARFEGPLGYASPYAFTIGAGADEAFRPPAIVLDPVGSDTVAVSPFTTTAAWATLGLSARLTESAAVEARLRSETFLTEPTERDAPGDGASYVSAGVAGSILRLDRPAWPTRGHAVYGYAASALGVGDQGDFQRASGEWTGYLPVAASLTAMGRTAFAWSNGEVPPHLRFRAGGVALEPVGDVLFDFPGYTSRSLEAPSLAIATVGLRAEVMPDRYLSIMGAVGGTGFQDRVRSGFSVAAGAQTPFGPLELTLMAPGSLSPIRAQVAWGYRF